MVWIDAIDISGYFGIEICTVINIINIESKIFGKPSFTSILWQPKDQFLIFPSFDFPTSYSGLGALLLAKFLDNPSKQPIK